MSPSPAKRRLTALRALILVSLLGAWLVFILEPALAARLLGLQPLDAGGWSALRSDIGGLLLGIGVFIALSFVGSARWLAPAIVLIGAVLLTRLVGMVLDGPSAVGILAALADVFAIVVLGTELMLFPWGLSRHPYHPAYAQLEWAFLPLHSRDLMGFFAKGSRFAARRTALPPDLARTRLTVPGFRGLPVPVERIRPVGLAGPAPAIIWLHGGAFVLPEGPVHRDIYARLARSCGCEVIAVDYTTALDAPYPAAIEDCLAAVRHVLIHAAALDLDPARIAVGGDSAGATLALAASLRLREAGGPLPCFQLLVCPLVDDTTSTPSARRYVDTPVWNTPMIHAALAWLRPDARGPAPWDLAPGRAESMAGLPPTWIETAEFDPMRDEARDLVDRLQAEGVPATWHEEPGTVHGFDVVPDAPPTRAAVRARHAALSRALHGPRTPQPTGDAAR